MHVRSVNLETVCGITSKIPDNQMLEIAFAGKSNVGKSSLINCMMNRKSYARISQKPGKTQTINFYNINDALYFVDLPGYGFAKVSLDVKKKWGKMIENYLMQSKQLRIIFLLVDIRHEPSKNDVDMYHWILRYGFNPIVIATKADKISRGAIQKHVGIIRKTLQCIEGTPIIPFSSLKKTGIEEVWEYIEEMMKYYEAEKTGESIVLEGESDE